MTDADRRAEWSIFEPKSQVGERLRQYWIPFLPVGLLDRQHARRVKVLGEDLVCYRDLNGTIGLISDRCPHRFVSLEWGIAAELGLRCPYHGWCFDETGQCIDIPVGGAEMASEISLVAHPVIERGGVLFGYLGSGEPPTEPEVSDLLAALPDSEISYCVLQWNWDEAFLCISDLAIEPTSSGGSEVDCAVVDGVLEGWGNRTGSEGAEAEVTASFHPPFYSLIAFGSRATVRIRVPVDELHTLIINRTSVDAIGEVHTPLQSTVAYEVFALDKIGNPLFDQDLPPTSDERLPESDFAVASISLLRDVLTSSGPVRFAAPGSGAGSFARLAP